MEPLANRLNRLGTETAFEVLSRALELERQQIQRELGCTCKTAWYMASRIRLAIQKNLVGMRISGRVKLDEGVIKADGGQATGNIPYAA